jgi:hypothetical protein
MIYRRIVFNWTHTQEEVNFVSNIHGLAMGIPFYCLMIVYFYIWFPKTKLSKFLDKITSPKILVLFYFVLVIFAIISFLLKSAAPLGTWTSAGLVFSSLLMCTVLLKDKIPNFLVLAIAVGITGMWIGFWEIPYQAGLKLIYDMPQVGTETAIRWIFWEILVEAPMCGCGLWIIIELNKKYHFVILNKTFLILLIVYVALITAWFLTGFWVDVWYDWKNNLWVQTTNWDKASMFIYKASKSVLLLALISLIWNKRSNCEKSNYSSIMDHA